MADYTLTDEEQVLMRREFDLATNRQPHARGEIVLRHRVSSESLPYAFCGLWPVPGSIDAPRAPCPICERVWAASKEVVDGR